jgi:tRNA dimethylallyltransferase
LVHETLTPKTKTVYIIAGPTAVGKTAIALKVAKALNTSIISADSRQCYKEITIGTAKPSNAELDEVKHYFISETSIEDNLTASSFEERSLNYLQEIFQDNNYAVVTGGTGLYIKALTDGLDEMPAVDPDVEAEVNTTYKEHGLIWLHDAVKEEDADFFAHGEINNPARLLRALVFKRSSGKSITAYRSGTTKDRPFRTIKIALDLPRLELYRRINARVDEMIKNGLLEEAKALYPKKHLKNLHTVGYSELFNHLDGVYSLEEAVSKIKQHSRNYAKRQITWFKKDKEYYWLRADDQEVVAKILDLK